MKATHVIRDMQQAQEKANKAFQQGDYQSAVEISQKALSLCSLLPEDVEFDKRRFEANVQAGLSAAFGRLSKHIESFAAANKALIFFDQIGELNPTETGKYLMAQVNQGTALAALGCLPAAVESMEKAKEIFACKGLDPARNRQWLEQVDGNIAAIKAQIEKSKL